MSEVTRKEFEELKAAVEWNAAVNDYQSRRLNFQRKCLIVFLVLSLLGLAAGKYSLSSDNREALERIAIGAIASGIAGIIGSQGVDVSKQKIKYETSKS